MDESKWGNDPMGSELTTILFAEDQNEKEVVDVTQ